MGNDCVYAVSLMSAIYEIRYTCEALVSNFTDHPAPPNRIEGKLIEYRRLRRSYAHYTDKVQGLHEKVDRQKKRASGASKRLESKLDRNRLKLSGAEEAHNDLGRSLLALIEEVTLHYWKDLVPLLHMMIQFSVSHTSDMATVMSKLEVVDVMLESISEEYGTSVAGRLEDLKPEPLPDSIQIPDAPSTPKVKGEGQEEKDQEEKGEDEVVIEEGISPCESQGLESV